MQFGLAFSFPFQDQEWYKKVGIPALIMLIPVVGMIVVMGWAVEICRRVIAKEASAFPPALDFGGWLKKGFFAFVISFVYVLPITLLSICQGAASGIIPLLQLDADVTGTIIMVVSICFGCLIALLGVVIGLIVPAAMAQYAATDQIGAAFRLGEVFGLLRAAPAAYVIVFLGSAVACIAASLGFIACCVGVLFTMAYAYAVQAHLWGQAYSVAKAKAAPAA